jgi:hypothetical protein
MLNMLLFLNKFNFRIIKPLYLTYSHVTDLANETNSSK